MDEYHQIQVNLELGKGDLIQIMSAVTSKSSSNSTSTSTSILVGIGDEKGASPPSPTPAAEHIQFHSIRDKGNSRGSHNDDTGALVDDESSDFNIVCDSINSKNAAAMVDMQMMTTSTYGSHGGGLISEIIEIAEEDGKAVLSDQSRPPDTTSSSLFSIDMDTAKDVVYVAVGETETSMDALLWTLNHALHPPNALVCLVHVFPPLKFVPGPMGAGKVPMSQVSPELADSYLAQHKSQMRQLMGRYMDKCTAYQANTNTKTKLNCQVPADTILIESDSVANAILELTSVLKTPKLVVGISKSKLRKLRGQKASGIVAHQILQNAPVGCEIKIVCKGKDVSDQGSASSPSRSKSPAASPKAASSVATIATGATTTGAEGSEDNEQKLQHSANSNSFSCCFKPNF
ncbi:hypothetical protein Cgig2_005385 [Carnegiea gigantea]|uniref:UspA domain-containing protein n=1 Tax=Carnegiea gigantea TaxID=171969 RepID=A0A9Q1K729_9CARY|nr:hypothetical protein Cgig2_005385 [Carnegiea gigantea]